MGDGRGRGGGGAAGASAVSKHGTAYRAKGVQGQQQHRSAKSDRSHAQRRDAESSDAESTESGDETADFAVCAAHESSAAWYDDDEEELHEKMKEEERRKTLEQARRTDRAQSSNAWPSSRHLSGGRGKKNSRTPPGGSSRYSRRGGSGGGGGGGGGSGSGYHPRAASYHGYNNTSPSPLPTYHRRSSPHGIESSGGGSRDMCTKYLGKKSPFQQVPAASKRGALAGRKGDRRADLFAERQYGQYGREPSYGDLSDMGGSHDYSEGVGYGAASGASKMPVACKYFSQGRCTKGDNCAFSHDVLQPHPHYSIASTAYDDVPPGACLDWFYSGTCAKGEDCHMLHFIQGMDFADYEDDEEEAPEPEPEPPADRPVCSSWLQGKCKQGQRCSMKHMATTSERDDNPRRYGADSLSSVAQGAGAIANTVSQGIAQLREKVNALNEELHPDARQVLTRTLQMALGRLTQQERDTLLGLPQSVIGLTRFRSVLIKRTVKYAFDACDLEAIECLARWEDHLADYLPECPMDGTFSKFFEQNLCSHYMELTKVMLASPLCRLRHDWLLQAVSTSTSPDPINDAITTWMRRAQLDGTEAPGSPGAPLYTPALHLQAPCTLRVRAQGFVWALKRQHPSRQPVYAGILPPSQPGVAAAAAGEAATCDPPSLFQQIMQFVPPVDWEYDVPLVDRDPGTHVFLDTLAAVLINYQMDVMNAEDKDAAREKIGETVWPHVVEGIGAEMAPHITGMLLTMDPGRLLLEAVNLVRFRETLLEAKDVFEKGE